jgi:hypothetical protein
MLKNVDWWFVVKNMTKMSQELAFIIQTRTVQYCTRLPEALDKTLLKKPYDPMIWYQVEAS